MAAAEVLVVDTAVVRRLAAADTQEVAAAAGDGDTGTTGDDVYDRDAMEIREHPKRRRTERSVINIFRGLEPNLEPVEEGVVPPEVLAKIEQEARAVVAMAVTAVVADERTNEALETATLRYDGEGTRGAVAIAKAFRAYEETLASGATDGEVMGAALLVSCPGYDVSELRRGVAQHDSVKVI